jgi:predicted MFS family arabinose efflux permease
MMEDSVQDSKVGFAKNRLVILFIGLCGMTVYLLPYVRYYYYDDLLVFLNITDMQVGILGSIYGAVAIVGYIFGGIFADKWSAKILMPLSLIATGGCGLLILLRPSFAVLVIIFGAWGITSILTFWNPMIKAVRSLCHDSEQGRGYALFDIARGILNFLVGLIVLAVYSRIVNASDSTTGMVSLFTFYSLANIAIGIISWFVLKAKMPEIKAAGSTTEKGKTSEIFKNILKCLKMPTTWCLIIIIFTSYGVIVSYYYVVPYCTAAFGMSTAMAAVMGYLANGFRILGCLVMGTFGDRKGLSTAVRVDFSCMVIGVIGLIFTPQSMSMIWLIVIVVGILCSAMYSLQALHFAIMAEGRYPIEITGAALAIATPLGYSAESVMPLFTGWCLTAYEGVEGYKVMFTGFIVLLAIGIVATLVWRKLTAERRAEMAQEREAAKLQKNS